MKKPNDPYTREEKEAIEREVRRAQTRGWPFSEGLLRDMIAYRMAYEAVEEVMGELGMEVPKGWRHPYERVNGMEEEIARQAARPLKPEARKILEKHGLLRDS